MTEPGPARPVPGPPRPAATPPAAEHSPERNQQDDAFADLAERPVAEHVAVFEAEHARLERELGTIDRL